MNEEWKDILKRFEAVWQRVGVSDRAETPAPAARTCADTLREFLLQEGRRGVRYAAAARLCAGRNSETLRALAADCRRCRGLLQTEQYLLTGETVTQPAESPHGEGFLSRLRSAYLAEARDRQRYTAAAAETEDEGLRALYADLAERCGRRKMQVHEMVQRVME